MAERGSVRRYRGLHEEALARWGRRIGEAVRPPAVLALRGPLGAGKSVLARAVARGAGVDGPVPSPTFNLLYRYPTPGDIRIVHMDLYRLRDPEELWELGWEEIPARDEVVLVEWPERAGPLLPGDRWDLRLTVSPEGPDLRDLRLERWGSPPDLPAPGGGAGAGESAGGTSADLGGETVPAGERRS